MQCLFTMMLLNNWLSEMWMAPDIHLVRSNRIIRFAVHSLKRHKAKAIETLRQDLLSGRLSSELTVRLHCKYLTFRPGCDFI